MIAPSSSLETLLREMVALDGTDLFVTCGHAPVVHARGRHVAIGAGAALDREAIVALARVALPPADFVAFEQAGDANAACALEGGDRFRVNAFRQRGEPGLVVRRIKTKIPLFEELGAPAVLASLASLQRGLVLVTGATGSGKSTTLAAMVDHRNRTLPGHIVTLEDPIEFVHENHKSLVTQREVGLDTPSFASGLKNALRQAPSVLLVGEIRDGETAEAALHFAETGHLVFSTLHATNANQTLKRFVNLFPAAVERSILHQLSLELRAVVSQRLIPRADGDGRVAAFEVMLNTPRASDLIRDGRIEELKEAMSQAATDGSMTFDACLFDLHRRGRITSEAAIAAADSQNDMKLRIRLEAGAGAAKTTPSTIRIAAG